MSMNQDRINNMITAQQKRRKRTYLTTPKLTSKKQFDSKRRLKRKAERYKSEKVVKIGSLDL